MLALPEALKLKRDTSAYTYLNQEVSRVGGMNDASNFQDVQVGDQCGAVSDLNLPPEPRFWL